MSIGISAALGAEVERLRAELAEVKRDKDAALEALADMVFQFFMEDGELLHHSFMSAEEHAIGVLIAQGRAEEVRRNRYRLIDAAMAGGAE